MSILGTISGCIDILPGELVEGKILYIELDIENYDILQEEIAAATPVDGGIVLLEQRVDDIGKGLVLNFQRGYKVVIVSNKGSRLDNFYIAFKTKII